MPGNGAHTGGGIVVPCAVGTCAAQRTDFSRFRSLANATDRVARGQVNTASRFNVTAGQAYRAGSFVEVEASTSGNFRTAVEWYDTNGASLGDSQIYQSTAATEARTLREATVTAPAGAVKAAVKFNWVGADRGRHRFCGHVLRRAHGHAGQPQGQPGRVGVAADPRLLAEPAR